MYEIDKNDLGRVLGAAIRRQRVMTVLTLWELAKLSGVSPSHLARIERGERFPSARVLRKIAKPLGLGENELFTLAGYFSHVAPTEAKESSESYYYRGLDPYVANAMAQESPETQRAVIGVLNILKNISRNITQKQGATRLEQARPEG